MGKPSWEMRKNMVEHKKCKQLIDIIIKKKSNLCISADLTNSKDLLSLLGAVGPFICMVKTHIDIVSDFTKELIEEVKDLACKHNFMIFEDRKFADLGSTVQKQFSEGIYRINEWADFINAHTVVGEGIIDGLKSVSKGQGLILIAQMSATGNMCTGNYTRNTVSMAEKYKSVVVGFICTEVVSDNMQFLNFVPGVHIATSKDNLGQQYVSPKDAIEKGADVVIVGRGIYKSNSWADTAKMYRDACFNAYRTCLGSEGS